MNLHNLQFAAILLVLAFLFLSRRSRGRARSTPAGLSFPIKPAVLFARIFAIAVYFALFAYPLWISRQSIPGWLLLLLFVAVLFGLYQLPGTIVLTPDAVTQRFWLRSSKRIPYAAIVRVSGSRYSQITHVFGPTPSGVGVIQITHGFNHADGQRFRQELAARSGKSFPS